MGSTNPVVILPDVDALTLQLPDQQPGVLLKVNVECSLAKTVENTMSHPGITGLTEEVFAENVCYCYSNEEVANVFLFLASDEFSFVTGANDQVGGRLGTKREQPQAGP